MPGPLEEGCDGCEYDAFDDDADGDVPLIDVSWKYLSRLYIFVPIISVCFLLALIALITWGWPPNADERKHGQVYPHPFFWKSFLVGLFASFTVQSLRVPTWVGVSWLVLSTNWTIFLSTVVHAILHEAIRLVSVPLTIPSPTSGFHSSYYLGLGWGVAEAAWSIVQGWEQLSLYRDVLEDCDDAEPQWPNAGYLEPYAPTPETNADADDFDACEAGLAAVPENDPLEGDALLHAEEQWYEDEAELERRVEVLERMRARQELEDAMGIPFPNIPIPLHLLWRLDTLLLNLGLTLILSAFYFDPEPIYKHQHPRSTSHSLGRQSRHEWKPAMPKPNPSSYLPLVWAIVCVLHISLSLVWKLVGRVGVGAVTWGGLIVALGTVFAGLGGWGGVV